MVELLLEMMLDGLLVGQMDLMLDDESVLLWLG